MPAPLLKYRFLFFILFSVAIIFCSHKQLDKISCLCISIHKSHLTRKDLEKIKIQLEKTKEQTGVFPSSEKFTGWYKANDALNLKFKLPLDRWGEPLTYKTYEKDKAFTISSSGKDLKKNTPDDIIIKTHN